MFEKKDLEEFFARFEGKKRAPLINAYKTSLENHLTVCRNALETQNIDSLPSSLHDIKSLCRMIGAHQEADHAEHIEQELLLKEQNYHFDQLERLIVEIEQILLILYKSSL